MSSSQEDKDGRNKTVAQPNDSTASESQSPSPTIEEDNSRSLIQNDPITECGTSQSIAAMQSSASNAPQTQLLNERCTGILYSTLSQPNAGRLVIIDTKVPGGGKPKEFNFNSPQHGADRSRIDNITVNLSNFLTRAQRNNCDVIIPASRSCRYPSTSYLEPGRRIVISGQQNFTQPTSTATLYHPNEFIGLNHVPTRNSVLMPNLYSGPDEIGPPVVDFSAPPPYESPSKLPSYEEVQREKELEADNSSLGRENQLQNTFSSMDEEAAAAAAAADSESKLLGTDFMFIISFFLALIFNWVGFLLLMCFCHTVAARYGALSGFGLSLAKWTILVKQTSAIPLRNAWLWWLIAVFGLLICIRSLFQYIHIKRGWRLMSATMQERLLVYY